MTALQKIEVKTVALTQNSFTKIVTANGGRKFLDIPNPAGAVVGLYYGDSPWCATLTGAEQIDADAVLASTQLLASTKGSIRARVKAAALSAVATIFSFSNKLVAAETSLVLYLDADNKLNAKLTVAGTEKWAIISTDAMPLSTWLDVKLVHNGTAPVLYVNGEQIAQTLTGTSAATKALWIGAIGAALDTARIGSLNLEETETLPFIGSMNNVAIVDGLSRTELNGTTDTLEENLPTVIANWKIEDGTGTNVNDISGNDYDATLSANTVWAAKGDTDALGAGQWFDEAIPVMAVWAYTAEAGKSLTIKEGW